MRNLLAILVCLVTVVGSSAFAEPFLFQELRQQDRVAWENDRFVVYSTTGIGQVTIIPRGDWPVHVTLRFCYSQGRGMERLENLSVSTQSVRIQGDYRNSREMPLTFVSDSQQEVGGTLNVELHLVKDALELTLPANFAKHAEYLRVTWVDVYR